MQCRYCYSGFDGETHDPACPELNGSEVVKKAFQSGWADGRYGKDQISDNPSYLLGYCRGKEEAFHEE